MVKSFNEDLRVKIPAILLTRQRDEHLWGNKLKMNSFSGGRFNMNSQELVICKLLEMLEEKYLTNEIVDRAILEGNVGKQTNIEIIDALCQTVITSLNFGNCKRAAEYLALAASWCERLATK